jgi:hypothetical protein
LEESQLPSLRNHGGSGPHQLMNHHKSKSQSQSIVISEGGGAYNGF